MNAKYLRWFVRPVEITLLQVPKALAASCFGAALDFGLLVVLVEGCGWRPLPAATVSYLVPCVVGYFICAYWIFPAQQQKVTTGLLAFLVLSLGGLAITWGTMGALFEGLGLSYALAKVVSFATAFSWNFVSRKYWVFRPSKSHQERHALVSISAQTPALQGVGLAD